MLLELSAVKTIEALDNAKELGFKYSCLSGISISYSDVPSVEKNDVLTIAQEKVTKWNDIFKEGLITEDEKENSIGYRRFKFGGANKL